MTRLTPYLVSKSSEGQSLTPLPIDHSQFPESWLQELLFNHSSILPLDQLDESFDQLISIGREIANIDNLFVTPKGSLCIVETKLWRNPEAHRTVVAQILDYAQTLTTWDYNKLDGAVRSYFQNRTGVAKSIHEIAADGSSMELEEIEFQQRVSDTLRSGHFALLIVGDRIHPSATQLAELIQSAPHLDFTMQFVELRCYRVEEDDWPLIVIPNVVAKSNEVTRAVVKIVFEEKQPQVSVETVQESTDSPKGKTTKVEFLARLPSAKRDQFENVLEKWVNDGYAIRYGTVGLTLRFVLAGTSTSVLEAYPDSASILQPKHVPEGVSGDAYESYKSRLMESNFLGSEFANGKRYVRFDRMKEGDLDLLLNATDDLINKWSRVQK